MNKEMVIRSMDRIEALLVVADQHIAGDDPEGMAHHSIRNARQIASAVRILVDE